MKKRKQDCRPRDPMTGEEIHEILIQLLSRFPRPEDAQRASAMIWRGLSKTSRCKITTNCGNPVCFNPEHLVLGVEDDLTSVGKVQ